MWLKKNHKMSKYKKSFNCYKGYKGYLIVYETGTVYPGGGCKRRMGARFQVDVSNRSPMPFRIQIYFHLENVRLSSWEIDFLNKCNNLILWQNIYRKKFFLWKFPDPQIMIYERGGRKKSKFFQDSLRNYWKQRKTIDWFAATCSHGKKHGGRKSI